MTGYCATCKKLAYSTVGCPHVCHPPWLVWDPERGDAEDGREVHAQNAEDAAIEWAEQDDLDSAEYSIAGGRETTVYVRPADQPLGVPERFVVYGECLPQYYAREAE